MEFSISSSRMQEVIDITAKVQAIIDKNKVLEGLCNVFTLHSTAAVIISENYDPNIGTDLLNVLDRLIPQKAGYLHDRVDGNAHAHIKSAMLGAGKTLPIQEGKLRLGQWQSIMLAEFDGPRSRMVHVELLPSP